MQKLDLGELEPCLRHRDEAHPSDVMQPQAPELSRGGRAPYTGWNVVESRQCPRVPPGLLLPDVTQ